MSYEYIGGDLEIQGICQVDGANYTPYLCNDYYDSADLVIAPGTHQLQLRAPLSIAAASGKVLSTSYAAQVTTSNVSATPVISIPVPARSGVAATAYSLMTQISALNGAAGATSFRTNALVLSVAGATPIVTNGANIASLLSVGTLTGLVAGWATDGAGNVVLSVTGLAGKTINWVVKVDVVPAD